MALTRKQKRWLRKHKGLVNTVKFLLFLTILIIGYYIATIFNEGLKPANLIAALSGGEVTVNETEPTTPEVTEPAYVSQLIEYNDVEELSELEIAARDYVVPEGVDEPYLIRVNRAANCVTVYGIDENGYYQIPVKTFAASTGKEVGDTPLGNGSITDKYTFHLMVDGTYAQYAVRFMGGGILFHSVPYYTKSKDDLETDQYNKLGSVASLGCVRLNVRDALWIYENCPEGTDVIVYDDESNPGPLGKPESIKIPEDSQFKGWDPTDPDEANPWRNYKATLSGVADKTITIGESFNPLDGVSATDTCGNDITDRIKLVGSVDLGIPGTYTIKFSVTDLIDSSDEATMTINVVE